MRFGVAVLVCTFALGCATPEVQEVVTVEASQSPYRVEAPAVEARLGEAPRIPGWSDAAHLRAVELLVDPERKNLAAEALVFQTASIKLSGPENVVAAVERLFADRLQHLGSKTAIEVTLSVVPVLRSLAPKPKQGGPMILRSPPDRPIFSAVCLDESAFRVQPHQVGGEHLLRDARVLTRDGVPAEFQIVYPLAKLVPTPGREGLHELTLEEDERPAGLKAEVLVAFAHDDLIVGHLEFSYSEPYTRETRHLWGVSALQSPSTRISEPFALKANQTLWLYLEDPGHPEHVLCVLLRARPGRSEG